MEIWRRNLYIIWFAQFLAMIGMNLVVPFLPFFIRDLGVTEGDSVTRWSGLVFAAPFLFSFFFTPFWGVMGDKYGRKLMVVRAIFGLAISQLLIGFSPNVEFLLFFRIIQGAISGFIPSALVLISSTTPKNKTGYAIGILQTSTAAGTVVGPLIGGFLADFTDYRTIFFITASLCFIAGMMIVKYVKEDFLPRVSTQINMTLRDNYKYVLKSSRLTKGIGLIIITQMAFALIQPIFALYIETFEINPNYISTVTGVSYSIVGIFLVVTSPFWGKLNDHKGYRKNLTITTLGASCAYVLQGFAGSAIQVIIFRAIQGAFMGGILPSLYSYVSKTTESDRRAGVMGIASSFFILANLIGPLIGGMSGSIIGIQRVFFISGLFLFISSIFIFKSLTEPTVSETNHENFTES